LHDVSQTHHYLSGTAMLQRLAVATVLGLAVGLERELRRRAAGLQTSSLVVVGAALFATIAPSFGNENDLRVVANIVTGVGFLAGGVILKDGMTVSGLNTAATMWAAAAVGALSGVGLFIEAAVAAAVIVGLNFFTGPLAAFVDRRIAKRAASNSPDPGEARTS
jgi:putative Mg2+ transporter-C (MgtC) family protein